MDAPIKMLSVDIVNDQEGARLIAVDALDIKVRINECELVSFFQTEDLRTRSEMCLSLLERGYQIANREHNIPIDALMSLHSQFRIGGYKNEWLFKRFQIKEKRMDIALICSFTSYDFSLNLECIDKDTGQLLASGPVFKTAPHEVYYDGFLNAVSVTDKDIVLDYFTGDPGIVITIEHLKKGIIDVSYLNDRVRRVVNNSRIMTEGLYDIEKNVVNNQTIIFSHSNLENNGVWEKYGQGQEW